MVLYNHPAENYFWRILGNLRPAEDSLPPTRKSAYDEQGFFFYFLSKIQRYMDKKKFKFSMPKVCT